ncbi:hypothetical protein CCACVL1_26751 [Corchorus capsularis]|uniref:Uncharacterized protein n=1 Tax=Corchorus capsularis TaxID=210143 RepID=A0A1R3GDG0_COCAP|nr:hypothetical protein CCACVL1_26751 [Corchorus capsularis]
MERIKTAAKDFILTLGLEIILSNEVYKLMNYVMRICENERA